MLAAAQTGVGASQERAANVAAVQGRLSADIRGLRAALEQAVRECRCASSRLRLMSSFTPAKIGERLFAKGSQCSSMGLEMLLNLPCCASVHASALLRADVSLSKGGHLSCSIRFCSSSSLLLMLSRSTNGQRYISAQGMGRAAQAPSPAASRGGLPSSSAGHRVLAVSGEPSAAGCAAALLPSFIQAPVPQQW